MARHDLADVGGILVTRADSLRVGNCELGTDEFVGRFLSDRRSATIDEIAAAVGRTDLAVLDGEQLTLARQIAAACLAAVRRHRREQRGGSPRLGWERALDGPRRNVWRRAARDRSASRKPTHRRA